MPFNNDTKTFEQTHLFAQMGKQLTSTLDFETIFLKLHETINEFMHAESFGVRIYHPEKNEVEVKYDIDKGTRSGNFSFSMNDDNNYSVWCIKNRKEIFINDNLAEHKKYVKKIVVIQGEMSHSLIFYPMILGDEVIGVITVQSYEKNRYTFQHLETLKILSSYAAIALKNAQLYENMEMEVNKRTQKIEEANKELDAISDELIEKNMKLSGMNSQIFRQKEEIEKSYKDIQALSEIGQDIIATLSVKEIIKRTYKSVNNLMDASAFCIGIYDETTNRLNFSGNMEKGKDLPDYYYDLNDKVRPAVWCFENQKEFFVNDRESEYGKYFPGKPLQDAVVGDNPDSIIYMPLTVKNKKIGVLTIQSFTKNAYTEYHLDILRNLAVYIATALENARLYQNIENEVKIRTEEVVRQKDALEKLHRNTHLFAQMGMQLTTSLDFETIFLKLHETINEFMDAENFGVRIYHPEKNEVEVKYEIDNGNRCGNLSFSMNDDNNYSVWCIKNRKEIFINDNLAEHKKYVNKIVVLEGEMSHSLIFYPMIVGDAVIGVITVQSYKKNRYTLQHLETLKILSSYAGIALKNAQLYENMETEVNKRTAKLEETNKELDVISDELIEKNRKLSSMNSQIFKQKEEIEKSYKDVQLLSEIGKEITASLSVEEIVAKTYKSVNELMDASYFGIGIYEPENNRIAFPGEIEKGERLPFGFYNLDDKTRSAIWCFDHQKEMHINDYGAEHNNFFPGQPIPKPVSGEVPESLIYYPLTLKNNKLGVISVQSFKKNAYTIYHLNLLKNIAAYVCIALENAKRYSGIEHEVMQRTQELLQQKETAEQAYRNIKLLSEIGQQITATLSVEEIIERTYENVNALMDASVFTIGIFNEKTGSIEIPSTIEKKKKLPYHFIEMNNKHRPAIWCYNNQKEIFMNDYSNDYNNYFPGQPVPDTPVSGERTNSLIYLPLTVKNKKIGVITVQSFMKNAYTSYHADILRNLAVYVATALENARMFKEIQVQKSAN